MTETYSTGKIQQSASYIRKIKRCREIAHYFLNYLVKYAFGSKLVFIKKWLRIAYSIGCT